MILILSEAISRYFNVVYFFPSIKTFSTIKLYLAISSCLKFPNVIISKLKIYIFITNIKYNYI